MFLVRVSPQGKFTKFAVDPWEIVRKINQSLDRKEENVRKNQYTSMYLLMKLLIQKHLHLRKIV